MCYAGSQQNRRSKTSRFGCRVKILSEKPIKLVILGLDALDPIWLWQWIDELPTFRSMIENGTFGPIHSTVPPLTVPAWVTMLTGRTPAELGSFGLFDLQKGYSYVAVDAARWKGEYLWDLVGARGKKVGVLGMPMLVSPYQVNGFLVTDPSLGETKAFPSGLSKKLSAQKSTGSTWKQMKVMWRMVEREKEFVLEAIRDGDLDFLFFALCAVDVALHWGTRKELKDAYLRIDAILSEIIEACKGCLVLVVSDHGCKEATTAFNVPAFLSRLGLLRFKRSGLSRLREELSQAIMRVFYRIPNLRVLVVNAGLLAGRKRILGLLGSSLLNRVDFERTQIFPFGGGGSWFGIWANRIDQFELGQIRSEDKNNVLDHFIRAISGLRDPSNGKRVLKKLLTREDLGYEDAPRFPDLVVQLEDEYFPSFTPLRSSTLLRSRELVHSDNGVFLATGPGIKKDQRICGLGLLDIAPTALHMLGMPVPRCMNGRVLREIFERGSQFAKQDVSYENVEKEVAARHSTLTVEEEERIAQRLKSLGYLG